MRPLQTERAGRPNFSPGQASLRTDDTGRQIRRAAVAVVCVVLALAIIYFMTAYEFVPSAWRFVERRHPALDQVGTRAFTAARTPGDPLNIAFIGSKEALETAMRQAGWSPADPITVRSSLRIAVDSVADRPYATAPVSDLFVNGRKQDLAFEQAASEGPSERHHVRFWKAAVLDAMGRPLWVGAATYDAGVGVSHTTGQITHHIAPDVDRERDKLVDDLRAKAAVSVKWVEDFQPVREGRNGGGDRFFTDGRLAVVVAASA